MVIELRVVQFWSEIKLVISNRTHTARSFDFEITRMISDQIALHSVQLPLCTYQCNAGGGGGRAWGGDLIVFVVPGVGHLTDLVLPGEGIFESFFARRGDI